MAGAHKTSNERTVLMKNSCLLLALRTGEDARRVTVLLITGIAALVADGGAEIDDDESPCAEFSSSETSMDTARCSRSLRRLTLLELLLRLALWALTSVVSSASSMLELIDVSQLAPNATRIKERSVFILGRAPMLNHKLKVIAQVG